MLTPSQILNREPLRLEEDEDGVFTVVNAYQGDAQDLFGTPLRVRRGGQAKRAARAEARDTDLILRGDEAELRKRVNGFLDSLDPGRDADPIAMGAVFEELKRSGSLCVSQIAIETGLPLEAIFFALRQLRDDGVVEWRPDRKRVPSFGKMLQKHSPIQLLHFWAALGALWREWRNSERRPYNVQLIETSWSINRSGRRQV